MKRRDVIKGLGLSLGYVVATPSVLGMLQSCKNEPSQLSWSPVFLSADEGVVLENLVDLILPKTEDLPGANDVDVVKFIDLYASKVIDEEGQKQYKEGLAAVMKALDKPINKLTTEDYDALLAKYLKADKEQREAFHQNEGEKVVLNTLEGIRGITIWAYKTSEYVGENVLAYDPVPGIQKGCISLEEATGGKAWSL
ncbi:MAG: gluconate 2-dehydrogenase subunit 3 family protein [Flavobacteriaceae bacterium]|nr:gluconate 2-dehydrogenase subunit 3 family protein [Flavobacteriaceae bacterium]